MEKNSLSWFPSVLQSLFSQHPDISMSIYSWQTLNKCLKIAFFVTSFDKIMNSTIEVCRQKTGLKNYVVTTDQISITYRRRMTGTLVISGLGETGEQKSMRWLHTECNRWSENDGNDFLAMKFFQFIVFLLHNWGIQFRKHGFFLKARKSFWR